MKYQLEATKDINQNYGDRLFSNVKGETLELSGAGAEIAFSTELGGAYKLLREIPETPEEVERIEAAIMAEKELIRIAKETEAAIIADEKARVKAMADAEKAAKSLVDERAALMAMPKEELIKKAEKLDIADADSMNKQPLVEAIVETKTANEKGDKS